MHRPHEFSLAWPKRLFIDRDEEANRFHVLAGEPIRDGTLLLLQLVDGTWLPGTFRTDPAPVDPAAAWAPPRFRVHLAEPATRSTEAGIVPRAAQDDPLTVEFDLPADAVLRVHPSWRRMMNPRPARIRHRRSTP